MEKNLLCQTCKTSGKADGNDHLKVQTTATDSAEPEVVSTQKLEPLRVRSAGHLSHPNLAFSRGCLTALKERKKTQEDSRGVFNHFSLQQILEQKNRGCQLHVTFLSKSLCVRAGILYYLHFQIPSVFAVLFSVSCHVLHLSISALSGAILKLRISQMVAQLSLESKQSQLSAERHQVAPN